MSIALTETSLTPDQFAALMAGAEGATFDLTLYSWLPSFHLVDLGTGSLSDFDAVVHQGVIYRLSGLGAFTLDGTPVGTYSAPVDAVVGASPSLISEGTNLYAFVITTAGISRNRWNGTAWLGWTTTVANANVVYIGAVDHNTVHFVTYDAAHKRYHFQVATYLDMNWVALESDIYWGFGISSFTAQRLNGKDVLAFTSTLPGTPTAKMVGTQLVKSIVPAGGVCVLTYQYGCWSDHIDIDHVDQWSAFRYRANLRMSLVDGTLWLTAYSSEGTRKNPILGTRMYASRDGIHWSRGELLALPGDSSQGVVLLRTGDQLYALPRTAIYQADSTLMFGVSAPGQSLNVSKRVDALSVSRRDMQQISVTLNNPDHWVNDSIIGQKRVMVGILKTGFVIDGVSMLQPVGFFEFDSYNPTSGMPPRMVTMTGRDPLAWLSSKTQSEQFVNWLPQGLGVDEYVDTDGTGYGGMTHSAPAEGSWMAFDGALRLSSNNERGIAYSTFLFDCWNGVVQTYFGLASVDNSEYGGVIFRSQDKDNGYVFRHDQDSHTVKFENWVAGVPTVLWQSGVKSWGAIATRFLRAEFHYSRIRLYSSPATPGDNANIIWALEQSLLVDGHGTDAACESGYVGVIGRGFSDIDSWSSTPTPFPPGVLPPEYPPYEPPPPDSAPVLAAAFSFTVGGSVAVFKDETIVNADVAGPITVWTWAFGDGQTSHLQHPVHQYAATGTYIVHLSVHTANSYEDNTSHPVTATSLDWSCKLDFATSDYGFTEDVPDKTFEVTYHGNSSGWGAVWDGGRGWTGDSDWPTMLSIVRNFNPDMHVHSIQFHLAWTISGDLSRPNYPYPGEVQYAGQLDYIHAYQGDFAGFGSTQSEAYAGGSSRITESPGEADSVTLYETEFNLWNDTGRVPMGSILLQASASGPFEHQPGRCWIESATFTGEGPCPFAT